MNHLDDAGKYLLAGIFNEIYEEQMEAEKRTEKQKAVLRRMRALKLRVIEGGKP